MRRVDPKHYTREYYLTDATGYNEFKKSWGKILEPRLKRIIQEIPPVAGLRVLDIGCGRGELVFWSARKGAKEALGIDYSKAAIKLANTAKKYYPKGIQNRARFKIMDAKKMNFPKESFDAVYLTEVLEHLYPEEQKIILKKIHKMLSKDGFLFIHTAPSRWFNDYTYRFWSYPMSTLLVDINNILTGHSYGNLLKPSELRTESHRIMHINEPDYLYLRTLFKKMNFVGSIKSTNITVTKPVMSWKDSIFNLIVYLHPLSNYPPLNAIWGNDFIALLKKI